MRKLILFAALALSLQTSAQLIESPASLNMDSTEFARLIGTVKEYNFQETRKYKSEHKRLVCFTGFKWSWLMELTEYLGANMCGNKSEVESGEDYVTFSIGCGFQPGHDIKITGYCDSDGRVKKTVIKGHADEIVKLFLSYWYTADLRVDQFKKGFTVYQDSGCDRITFNWSNAQPTLTITKNPNLDFTAALQ